MHRLLTAALFFITIGMMLNPATMIENAENILGILALLTIVKALLVVGLMKAFKRPLHQVIQLSVLLAQGSELTFVILSRPNVESAIGNMFAQELIAAITLSMFLTPLLSMLANRWSLKICNALNEPISNCPDDEQSPLSRQPVFIVGMNELGKTLARGMRAHKIPYIAVDHDRKRFLEATAAGYIVAFGRTRDLRFWNTLGVRRARAICIASPRYEVAREIAPIVNRLFPNLKRYVAVNDSADGVRFAALGLKPFHNQGAPPGLEMASFILKELGMEEETIGEWSESEQSAYLETHSPSVSTEIVENGVTAE